MCIVIEAALPVASPSKAMGIIPEGGLGVLRSPGISVISPSEVPGVVVAGIGIGVLVIVPDTGSLPISGVIVGLVPVVGLAFVVLVFVVGVGVGVGLASGVGAGLAFGVGVGVGLAFVVLVCDWLPFAVVVDVIGLAFLATILVVCVVIGLALLTPILVFICT
jgi:hypothetical protein